jgi:hypothetical protein
VVVTIVVVVVAAIVVVEPSLLFPEATVVVVVEAIVVVVDGASIMPPGGARVVEVGAMDVSLMVSVLVLLAQQPFEPNFTAPILVNEARNFASLAFSFSSSFRVTSAGVGVEAPKFETLYSKFASLFASTRVSSLESTEVSCRRLSNSPRTNETFADLCADVPTS